MGNIRRFFEDLRQESAYRDIVHFAEFLDLECDAAILHNVAYAHSCLRQSQPAVETARRALREAPNDVEALLVLAEVLVDNRETLDEACQYARRAISLDCQNPDVLERSGIVVEKAGAHAEALEHFNALTRLRADYPTCWLLKGRALVHLDRREEAEAAFRQVLTLDANNANAHKHLGILRFDEGAYPEALEHFEALTRLRADYPTGWWLKGRVLENLDRCEEAEAAYRQPLTLDANHIEAWAQQARLCERLGKTAESENAYNNAIRLSSGQARAQLLNRRGESRRLRNDFQAALADYQDALVADPEAVWPRFNTVTVQLALGNLEGALDEYPRALTAALRPGSINEGLIVQSLYENWESLFMFGHEAHWARFLDVSLRLLAEREGLRYAEMALPLMVFALLYRCKTIQTGRLEQIIEHLHRAVAPFIDISVAKRFLQVGIAHFKEQDPKALMRLPLEERQVFARELELPQ